MVFANRKIFTAVPTKRLLGLIEENERITKELLPELDLLYNKSKETQEANIFKGKKGIKSILNDILTYKEYVAFGSSIKFLEAMKDDFLLFQKRKKELKIKSRVILSEKVRNKDEIKKSYGKYKFIEDRYASPISTYVYGDNVTTIVWCEVPIATIIDNKEVADSFRNYFEIIWKSAKS